MPNYSMTSFVLNAEGWLYDKAYEVFLRSSDYHLALENSFKKHLPRALQHLQLDINKFNILSIGAGSGNMDRKILEILLKHTHISTTTNTAIEPHAESIQKYEYLVNHGIEWKDLQSNVRVHFENKTLHDYTAGRNRNKNQFDLIHAVHSFYFVYDVETSLRHCFESELKNEGIIMLVATPEDTSIFRKLYNVIKNHRPPSNSPLQYMGTKGFVEVIQKCQFKHTVHPCLFTIDVTKIFNDEEENTEGNLLLDFLTFERDFRKRFDKKVVNEVCDLLMSYVKEDVAGRMIVEVTDELVIVFKMKENDDDGA